MTERVWLNRAADVMVDSKQRKMTVGRARETAPKTCFQ